jgi:hypothetical protein
MGTNATIKLKPDTRPFGKSTIDKKKRKSFNEAKSNLLRLNNK